MIIRVKKLRENRNMTTEQLAKKVGVSEKTIEAIENGSLSPTVDKAIKISRELNSVTDYVFEPEN